jgi:hypothetical protein
MFHLPSRSESVVYSTSLFVLDSSHAYSCRFTAFVLSGFDYTNRVRGGYSIIGLEMDNLDDYYWAWWVL